MTTYKKPMYGVTGSTQGADAPLVRATDVMKTNNTHMIVQNIKNPVRTPKKRKKEKKKYNT